MNKIKWGLLGLGNIAHKFCRDLKLLNDSELVAVCSSSFERAKNFAQQYNVLRFYGNYEELYNDSDIDIIYIASIHPHHAQHSISVMKAGKSVLCEKPLAMNKSQVLKMIDVSKKNRVFLMEGLWTRFNPIIQKAYDLVHNGELGDITYMRASFNFYGLNRSKQSRIFDPQKGGGALLDIGIYCVFLAYLFLGKPLKIFCDSILSKDKVDLQTAMIFKYQKAQAVLHCGFLNNEHMVAKIGGTKGELQLNHQWHNPPSMTIVKHDSSSKTIDFKTQGVGFTHQIQHCNESIRENKLQSHIWSHQNSIDLAILLDWVRTKCHIIYPKEVILENFSCD